MAIRHFLDIWQMEAGELRAMLDEAHAMKAARRGWPKGRVDEGAPLDGHILAMIFEKSSTRTRTSFDVGIRQLGGSSIVLNSGDMQLGRGDSIGDTARVLSRHVHMVMTRPTHPCAVEDCADRASDARAEAQEGFLGSFGIRESEANELSMKARVAAGWFTEEELLAAEREKLEAEELAAAQAEGAAEAAAHSEA